MTNADAVLDCLSKKAGKAFCDDCLSEHTSIRPRQQVNQICNRLFKRGRLAREKGDCSYCSKRKTINCICLIGQKESSQELSGPRSANRVNPGKDRRLESIICAFFREQGFNLIRPFSIDVGINRAKKSHKFDLGSDHDKILIECEAHTWTKGGNVPSAKMTIWNEAMYYFYTSPNEYRKILVVLRACRNGESLAEYYIGRYEHLIPEGVEIWEFDEDSNLTTRIYPKTTITD